MSKKISALFLLLLINGICAADTFDNSVKGFLDLVRMRTDNACIALTDSSGNYLVQYRTDSKLIPASILKVPLANVAIDFLSQNYRFSTELYTDNKGNLVIKGYGDPFLISEEINIIAKKIYRKKYRAFRTISVDSSAFRDELPNFISNSNNPYDAINGALVVNFNTVFIGKDRQGSLYSAETQTPLTDISRSFGSELKNNTKARFNTGKDKSIHERYVAELFSEIFARNGVFIKNISEYKPSQSKLKRILTHNNTRPLREIIASLMKYSNNFIANQIMAVMGAEYSGFPADMAKGVKMFNKVTEEIFPEMNDSYNFAEGSGLSRENRVTCRFMIKTLLKFKRYYNTMPFKSSSYYKTGSLKGINNLTGYIQHKKRLFPFVMILYTPENERFRFLGILENLIRLKYK